MEYSRIFNALVGAAMTGAFHAVTIDTNTKLVTVAAGITPPASALANEKSARFDLAKVNRQSYQDDRSAWEWELILHFNQHVSCEEFELAVTTTPIVIDRDASHRQVSLRLRGATYEHPLQQQPSTGTRAVFMFEASLSPL